MAKLWVMQSLQLGNLNLPRHVVALVCSLIMLVIVQRLLMSISWHILKISGCELVGVT